MCVSLLCRSISLLFLDSPEPCSGEGFSANLLLDRAQVPELTWREDVSHAEKKPVLIWGGLLLQCRPADPTGPSHLSSVISNTTATVYFSSLIFIATATSRRFICPFVVAYMCGVSIRPGVRSRLSF